MPFWGGPPAEGDDSDITADDVIEVLGLDPESGAAKAVREEHRVMELQMAIEEERRMTGPTQYAITAEGNYSPVGNTTDHLPPGMYEPVLSNGQLFFIPMAIRTDDILRFPDAVTDRVVKEIQTFWDREDTFKGYGFPFKRGMLLYGPPGSGKSTTLQLVARDVIQRGGFVLQFTPSWLHGYRAVRSVQPDVPIVSFMEDIDALLERRESDTLNLLDGAEKLHKVVFLATTNYLDKLQPRVKNRPSRFDRRFEIAHPTAESRELYLKSLMVKEETDFPLERAVTDTKGFSFAHVKELFVATVIIGQPYQEALRELREMIGAEGQGGIYV